MIKKGNLSKNQLEQIIGKHKRKICAGIIGLFISGFAYASYFPRKLTDSTITSLGTYQGNSYWSVGGAYIPIPFIQPKIYINNHQKCLRSELADKLKVGDQLSEIVYTWGAWEECDYLRSNLKK